MARVLVKEWRAMQVPDGLGTCSHFTHSLGMDWKEGFNEEDKPKYVHKLTTCHADEVAVSSARMARPMEWITKG
jgi:hypothetical protein